MNEKYKSIMNRVHHQSSKYPRMSMVDRAAQFGSFAALTGHSDAIKEEARLVDVREELNEEQINELNSMLRFICDNIGAMPCVKVTYFVPDDKKTGGMYITESIRIKKVDLNERILISDCKKIINIDDIQKITDS